MFCPKALPWPGWFFCQRNVMPSTFTGCNELLVPCHCFGTLTIIDGYWYIENKWMNIEKRLHKIFIGWERYLYLGLDWFLKVTKCSRVYLSLIFSFTLIVFLFSFALNDCISLFRLLFVKIMKHVVQDQVITVLVFRLQ